MGAGHASTSIGYAVGIKEAMRRGDGDDGKVVAVIGDGAMTGGVAFEAVHQAGGLGTPIVVILNDNGMSIAPNVGALSRYFNRVRLEPGAVEGARGRRGEAHASCRPASARAFERLGPQLKESIKAFWAPGLFWEELDWAYMGVIDGHDVRALRRALRAALRGRAPRRHPLRDGQGQGLRARRGRRPRGHGEVARRQAEVDRQADARRRRKPAGGAPAPPQYTQVFGEALVRECERDQRVVGITAAMNSGTGPEHPPEGDARPLLRRRHRRAAGGAVRRRPRAPGLAPGRRDLLDLPAARVRPDRPRRLPAEAAVVFAMDRAGLVGDDGPTHHGVFDIAYLRCLPNITLMAPRDEAMLVHMLHTALQHDDGPVALRYPRGEAVGVPLPAAPSLLEIGTGEILREGERVALVGYGTGVGKALGAADLLAERGLDVTVADARFAKPLDAGLLAQLAAEHELLVTVEEGVLAGGFGTAVWEVLSEGGLAPRILRVGLPDRYVTHGAPALLHEEVGFTPERIAERIEAAVLDPRGSLRLAASGSVPRMAAGPPRHPARRAGSVPVALAGCRGRAGRRRAPRARPPARGEARPARRRRRRARRRRAAAVRLARRDQARERARRARRRGRRPARARRRRLDRRVHRLPAAARRGARGRARRRLRRARAGAARRSAGHRARADERPLAGAATRCRTRRT